MAIRQIAVTDTLETFRTEFNNLAALDFGDIATLSSAGLSSTSVVGAVIELSAIVAAGQGFFIEDSSSSVQLVGAGQTLRFFGTANQLNAVVSSPDTMTVSLTNDVNIVNDLGVGNNASITGLTTTNTLSVGTNATITGNLTVNGSTHTLGNIEFTSGTIRVTTSSELFINDTLKVVGFKTKEGSLTITESAVGDGTFVSQIDSPRADKVIQFPAIPVFENRIAFEGSTSDNFETVIEAVDPTADRTIFIPNISGTFITTGDSGTVSSTMIAANAITTTKISNSQVTEDKVAANAISSGKLKSAVNLQILNSSGGIIKSLFGAGI